MQPKPFRRVAKKTVLRHLGGRYAGTSTFGSVVAKAILAAVSVAAFCCFVSLSKAAGPTNDLCSGAEVLPGTAGASSPYYTSVKDITLATTNATDPPRLCQTSVGRSVWYLFTPNSNAIYTISTCNDPTAPTATTVSDTVMAIYQSSGGCAGFVGVDCSDDTCGPGGLQSSITRQLLADTTYYIVVWQYFPPPPALPPEGGLVQLRVTRAIRPPNDTCATATPVPLNFPIVWHRADGVQLTLPVVIRNGLPLA